MECRVENGEQTVMVPILFATAGEIRALTEVQRDAMAVYMQKSVELYLETLKYQGELKVSLTNGM